MDSLTTPDATSPKSPSPAPSQTDAIKSTKAKGKGGRSTRAATTPTKDSRINSQKKVTTAFRKRQASEFIEEEEDLDEILDDVDDVVTESEYESLKKKTNKRKRTVNDRSASSSPAPAGRQTKAASAKKSKHRLKNPQKKAAAETLTPASAKGKEKKMATTPTSFDPRLVANLAAMYPDTYWDHFAGDDDNQETMINSINEEHPLHLVDGVTIRDDGHITGMILSPDGTMLVTFCNLGIAKIWDVETFELMHSLNDEKEENIDEFYVGRFTPDMTKIAVAGKLKDPRRWSEEDEDNHILPCPVKIFDIVTGEVIERLENHEEEILCIKAVTFKGENYFVSTSQDGYINKWKMDDEWGKLAEHTRLEDGVTCMAFTVGFLPNTGNKYLIAACDENIRLFDFETAKLVQTFEGIYTSYCDCVKVVRCLDYPAPPATWADVTEEVYDDDEKAMFTYLISRGVEELDAEDFTISSKPNSVTLHKLTYPKSKGGKFELETVKRFMHEEYRSNSWLIKITSNGRYIAAPTYDGSIIMFNMKTGSVGAILRDHQEIEIRDVLFHPFRKLFFSCGDDGTVKVYGQCTAVETAKPEKQLSAEPDQEDPDAGDMEIDVTDI
ncbi:hypothetical protein HK097_005660 [Rhizophlyctis rosea]|uniref:WD repeat-containing protein 55 homolog n=1 Tax=Rhizophlyctis rosea TaxID=64517 RepID=A0AAD5SL36_9FUNG|nr:hypothetical protein HK097_005660 [Rhizophlyctis rosea]